MSKTSDAIAVLRIGGSFADAMTLTGLSFEHIKQIWNEANETDRLPNKRDEPLSTGHDGRKGVDQGIRAPHV